MMPAPGSMRRHREELLLAQGVQVRAHSRVTIARPRIVARLRTPRSTVAGDAGTRRRRAGPPRGPRAWLERQLAIAREAVMSRDREEMERFVRQGQGIREVLQAVEDSLIEAGYDDFVV